MLGFIKESLQKKKFKKESKGQISSRTSSVSPTPNHEQEQLILTTFFDDFIKFFERSSPALIYKHFGLLK